MLGKASKKIGGRLSLGAAASLLAGLTVLAVILMMAGGQKEATASDLAPALSPPSQSSPAESAPAIAEPGPAPAELAPAAVTVSIELCAKEGTITMPDTTVIPIWGFALKDGDCSTATATLPGPTLDVGEGDTVTVTLDNSLSEDVSIVFPGQDMVPDAVGAPPAGSTSYTFVADAPGTYLYESGTNTDVQLPMGLYGALIVRPTMGASFAYNHASTEFDVEALLVLSEIDPDLNMTADPNDFDSLDYDPTYWLINGKAYPDTDEIVATRDDRLLLRYLNPGVFNHTMKLVGYHQQLLAGDGNLLSFPVGVVSQTVSSGQTFDLIGTLPVGEPPDGPPAGTRYPLFSAQQHVTNAGAFSGGMMTFIVDAPLSVTANCSSELSMSDALIIARYVVGLEASPSCSLNADVNRDGDISMADALTVAGYVIGVNSY